MSHRAHLRSIIFRREYKQLKGIEDRARELFSHRGRYNGTDKVWRLNDARVIELGAVQLAGDEEAYQGRPHDFIGFDELAHFLESQFRFLCGWLRTPHKGQRTRIICASNPPTSAEGEWMIQFWRPWLDETHPNPAMPGELRWFARLDDEDIEVDGPEPFEHEGERVYPKSRTFIPASVEDNPYSLDTGYKAQLQALPEPLRSKLLYGDFNTAGEDHPWQVIPSEWVRLAQERWTQRARPSTPMSALGVDVARGGRDRTVLTPRFDNWFAEQHVYPGSATPDGPAVAALAITHRDAQAVIGVDVIGVGASVYDHLNGREDLHVVPLNSSAESNARDKSGQLGFLNKRAEWWWKLREDLDPASGQDLALPPGRTLAADLCTPRWKPTPRGVQVESKEDIIKRIGRSPDEGESLLYAHATTVGPDFAAGVIAGRTLITSESYLDGIGATGDSYLGGVQ